jgi:coproporphyrinogen III oxidase-like Fe-S oxidoreductase
MRLLGVRFDEDRSWTADRVMGEFIDRPGLYVHVPFCSSLCPFCPYNKVRYSSDLAAGYLERLHRETERYLAARPGPFTSLYVGGGTPTLCLGGLEWLRDRVAVLGERAIEVLPTHMTPETADRLESLDFDAVSIGVQSFQAAALRHLARPTTVEDNRRAVALARERFACVDVDLIFDVVYDAPGSFLCDLEEAFSYGVDQVSTYPLMRFGYTPFGKAPHDARTEHSLLGQATRLAERRGYRRASVWSFVRRDGRPYSSITRPYYLGVGAGASTFTGRAFLVNHFGVRPYMSAVDAGRTPIARVGHLGPTRAAVFRAFWQVYTGTLPRDGDPLLRHPAVRSCAAAARVAGWFTGEGTMRLTPSGYERYHDLERWVTYRLIEPLWEDLMTEHRPETEEGSEHRPETSDDLGRSSVSVAPRRGGGPTGPRQERHDRHHAEDREVQHDLGELLQPRPREPVDEAVDEVGHDTPPGTVGATS